jgi:hypothetical protein
MAAEDGKPLVDRHPLALGVRVGGGDADVVPEDNNHVHPGAGGMSVAPSLRLLPLHRIPKRLGHLVADARGKDHCFVWCLGEGGFVYATVASGLHLRPDPEPIQHGVIEPSESMELTAYEMALVATRDQWSIDEQ